MNVSLQELTIEFTGITYLSPLQKYETNVVSQMAVTNMPNPMRLNYCNIMDISIFIQ